GAGRSWGNFSRQQFQGFSRRGRRRWRGESDQRKRLCRNHDRPGRRTYGNCKVARRERTRVHQDRERRMEIADRKVSLRRRKEGAAIDAEHRRRRLHFAGGGQMGDRLRSAWPVATTYRGDPKFGWVW